VQEVQEFELRVSLPGHLQGCVPITNISPAYTAYLRSGCSARICKPLKEPMNRFPAWRDGTKTLFEGPAGRLHMLAEYIPGLLKRLKIRALLTVVLQTENCTALLSLISISYQDSA
jgi:hypothetical protein